MRTTKLHQRAVARPRRRTPPPPRPPRPLVAHHSPSLVPVATVRLRPGRVRALTVRGTEIHCLLTTTTRSSLVALDLVTGQETRRVTPLPRLGQMVWAADGSALGVRRTAAIGRGPTVLVFLDPEGHVITETSVPDATSQIASAPDRWYVGCRNGLLYTFDRQGLPSWTWRTPGSLNDCEVVYQRPCPYSVIATSCGVVVASFADLYTIDPDGRMRWHAALPDAPPQHFLLGDDDGAREEAYTTLGLTANADPVAIRTAYRRLARATHPDHHPTDPDAATKFAAVQAAYEQVADPPAQPDLSFGIQFAGFATTVTALAVDGDGTARVGTSEGQWLALDANGCVTTKEVLNDHVVRAACRADSTCAVAVSGNALRFEATAHVIHCPSSIREPRRLTAWNDHLVWWKDDQLEVIAPSGHVVATATFGDRLTHVAAHEGSLVCVSGGLVVLRAAADEPAPPDSPIPAWGC